MYKRQGYSNRENTSACVEKGVISEDKIENLKKLDKDELWLNNILKMHKIKRTKDVLLCVLDEYDGVLIQKKR